MINIKEAIFLIIISGLMGTSLYYILINNPIAFLVCLFSVGFYFNFIVWVMLSKIYKHLGGK